LLFNILTFIGNPLDRPPILSTSELIQLKKVVSGLFPHEIDYVEVSITAQNHSNFPIARVEHTMEEM
jgi:hypothetical protein